mmetsp:Transcript_14762/g.35154  ORF Transcript_14762/g.35154 Transcript_14762/m.35154 type:complete len:252 (+) Transcript_14762:1054-1809(+)
MRGPKRFLCLSQVPALLPAISALRLRRGRALAGCVGLRRADLHVARGRPEEPVKLRERLLRGAPLQRAAPVGRRRDIALCAGGAEAFADRPRRLRPTRLGPSAHHNRVPSLCPALLQHHLVRVRNAEVNRRSRVVVEVRVQRLDDCGKGRPLRRVVLHALHAEVDKKRIRVGRQWARQCTSLEANRADDLHCMHVSPGPLPCENLPENHPKAVHVCCLAVAFAAEDFGRHPLRRASCRSGAGDERARPYPG